MFYNLACTEAARPGLVLAYMRKYVKAPVQKAADQRVVPLVPPFSAITSTTQAASAPPVVRLGVEALRYQAKRRTRERWPLNKCPRLGQRSLFGTTAGSRQRTYSVVVRELSDMRGPRGSVEMARRLSARCTLTGSEWAIATVLGK